MEEADAKLADGALSATDDSPAVSEPTVDNKKHTRLQRRMTATALMAVVLAAALVLPGMVNLGHYKRQIATLMSQSMGRPVRMSGVELRLLPTPGFVLHDLAVSEDPEFGAEPILFARTVVASIRVVSLLRGRIEISRVSVDEASLNLVRSAEGRWNLEALMTGAPAGQSGGTGTARHIPGTSAHFPYLEATESRVHLKNGVVKSPYSIEDTDLTLWQDAPGQWRVRLRGQPMRTDIPMSLADTGELRLEASLQSAPQLRDMPLKLDMEWRNAQLGQLSRLLTGSDAGWRGDLTADIAVQGTPESAQTKARLRATGVRRAEFAPDTPLDFDANCGFRYQHSLNAAHEVNCNTAIGDGRLDLKAELPGKAGPPEAMLEVKAVPLQAGLDLLRTVRSGFAPGIEAKGAVNGSLAYKQVAVAALASGEKKHHSAGKTGAGKSSLATPPGDLQGALTLTGAELSGGQLTEALKLPEITLTPTMVWDLAKGGAANAGGSAALTATFAVPLGKPVVASQSASASTPAGPAAQSIAVQVFVHRQRYQIEVKGTSSVDKMRELAYSFGLPRAVAVDNFSGGTADFDLTSIGPWIAADDSGSLSTLPGIETGNAAPALLQATLTLNRTEWHADYLLHPVELPRATVKIAGSDFNFASDFVYGKAKDAEKSVVHGLIEIDSAKPCTPGLAADADAQCTPQVQIRFGALDASSLETAMLGAPEEKSLLAPLLERMRGSDRPKWPPVTLIVEADSLVLGPATLEKASAEIHFEQDAAVVKHWNAGLLGGTAEGTGRFSWADDKPQYAFDGSFTGLNAAPLGALLGGNWAGGPVGGSGNVELSGRTSADLAASAKGTVHFEWQHGSGLAVGEAEATSFDDWSGTSAIQGGKLLLGDNLLALRRRKSSLAGSIPFSGPASGAVGLTVAPTEVKLAETKKAVK